MDSCINVYTYDQMKDSDRFVLQSPAGQFMYRLAELQIPKNEQNLKYSNMMLLILVHLRIYQKNLNRKPYFSSYAGNWELQ